MDDSDAPEKAVRLLEWMESKAVWWNRNLMRFRDARGLDSAGVGLWAQNQQPVSDGDHLCTIPKSALLSVRNTSIADVLEAEKLSGGLGLSFAVMFERALPASPWSGYLDFLPSREYLPMFWPEALLQLLHGTSLPAASVHTDASAMREDFGQVQEAMDKHPKRFKDVRGAMTFASYQIAAAWVSSRAFYVDAFHGMCMVPLADVFNHKAAVVTFSSDYTVAETDDAENLFAASMHSGESADAPEAASGTASEQPTAVPQKRQSVATGAAESPAVSCITSFSGAVSVKQPRTEGSSCVIVPEEGMHEMTEQRKDGGWGLPSVSGMATGNEATLRDVPAELRLEIAIIDTEENVEENEGSRERGENLPGASQAMEASTGQTATVKSCGIPKCGGCSDSGCSATQIETDREGKEGGGSLMIVAASEVAAGSEIHNTYGEYSNVELLYKHGFALRRNPFNSLSVSMSEVGAAAAVVLGEEIAQTRMQWLRSTIVDCSEEDEEEGESADEDNTDEDGVQGEGEQSVGDTTTQAKDDKEKEPCHDAEQGQKRQQAQEQQVLTQAVQGKVGLDGENDLEDDEGGEGEMGADAIDLEERIDASALQIFDGGRATVAMLGVLWCLGESMHGPYVSGASAEVQVAPPAAAVVLQRFTEWLDCTLRAVGAGGGSVAAEAQRIVEGMKGDGEEGDDEFLEQKVPLEMVVGALDSTAVRVLHGIMGARLEVLELCVVRVDAAAAVVKKLANAGASGGIVTAVAAAVKTAEGVHDAGVSAEISGEAGAESCTLAEVEQAITGVERLAKWEVAAVQKVLSVCDVTQN